MQPLGIPIFEVFPRKRPGSESNVKLLQLKNASFPMLNTLLGIVIVISLEHPWNASRPMLVTLFGIATDVSSRQPENIESPMLVMLSGIEIDVKSE